MRFSNKKVEKLVEKYKEISLLGKVSSLLNWDLNVNLPERASKDRAELTSYLTELIAEKWLDSDFRKLLEDADREKAKLNLEEKAILRNLNYRGKYFYKVPKRIATERVKAASRSYMAWRKARENNRFSLFKPYLERNINLGRKVAEYLGYAENPYDALLDRFEPGLTAAFCKTIFSKLQVATSQLLGKIQSSKDYEIFLSMDFKGSLDPEAQRQISLYILKRIGYDFDAGRLDSSTHPFTMDMGSSDVRITTREKYKGIKGPLISTLHEGGHALHYQGVKKDYALTPLKGRPSHGISESQSLFWQNQVGLSFEFIKSITPTLKTYALGHLSKMDARRLYLLLNRVNPGPTRLGSDEITYNLHIALRFELENDLINSKLAVKDLPEAWRAKMKKYLGVVPKTDREGALQDIHWSQGAFGYFPTYTLGNLYAAQITETMKKELDLDDLVERGELGTILSWLRTNIHQYGSLYWPDELIKKITGRDLDPNYFLRYINKKYSKIYNIK